MRRVLFGVSAAFAMFIMIIVSAPQLSAHDEFRIIGTLTRVTSSEMDVKQKDNQTVSIKLDKQTLITRDKKTVKASELKKGQSVVVDALGDDLTDVLALEVRIVPTLNPPAPK
jgi:hypothetical protein